MAGYTRAPFRAICRKFGCGLVFTEVVTAEGIIRHAPKTMCYLESFPGDRPLAAHIYGSNQDSLARAAQVIESLGRFDSIDINCGCPVPKVMRTGSGVALMRDPDKLRAIVQAVSQATPLPVTIKTRLGPSRELFNISEVAQAAEEGGASAIFLHARFGSDKHQGPVDLQALKRVKEERSIPVIGNGGITEAQHAAEMIQRTGVDGVMIGRGAIGNPWIFQEIQHLWSGKPYDPPSNGELADVIQEHLHGLRDLIMAESQIRKFRGHTPEQAACRKFRGHLVKYLKGMKGIRNLQRKLMTLESVESVMMEVARVLDLDTGRS
jgi:nifR3 family TIM-barrel protein